MSDRFVTVASYVHTPEAQMAKNLLESEGIPAFLAGELTANTLTGAAGEAHLQVHEQNAARAVSLLAAVAANAALADDWEAQAEKGLWTCPLCGTAVALGVDVCPACHTANTSITTDRRDTWAPQSRAREAERIKQSDQIQVEAPRSALREVEETTHSPRGGPGCGLLLLGLVLVCYALFH